MVFFIRKIITLLIYLNLIKSFFFRNKSFIYNINKINKINDFYKTLYINKLKLLITFFIRINVK